MSETKAPWSPARAVLPPDPNGHNRALDRVAAEHLREVAPHLAPKEETGATQARPDASGYPYFCDERPTLPAPPQPEPTKADVPRKGSKAWAIQEACRIVGIAFHGIAEYDEASDCFCSEGPSQDYRNGGRALAFVEAAVREKLAREKAPAPPAEATGEMSREEFAKHGSAMLLLVLQDARPRYDEFVRHFNAIAECDAALRTRAREAEEQEAKWRRELSAACELSERAREIVVSALNQPPEHFYDKHDNGEWSAEHIAFAIRSLFRERDEAREQLAKETERADKEYERCELWKRTTDDVAMERDALRTNLATERAARVKAEEYKDRLRGECVGTLTDVGAYMLVDSDPTAPGEVASAIRRVARELDQNAARLAAAEARIARLVRAGDDLARWVDTGSQAAQNWKAAKADAPAACKDGLPHSWGIDGQHPNEFCKVCYVDRPKGTK